MSANTTVAEREKFPRFLLRAMAILVVVCLALVSYARITDRPLEAKPAEGEIAQERLIHVFASMNGAAKVLDSHGAIIADLAPTEGGFVAGVWRALDHVRGNAGIDPNAPVRLIRYADGRLALKDDFTGWRVELIGFGADNTAAFARLLEQ